MNEFPLKESNKSWRARFGLMITEGRKLRVSSHAVRVVIWTIALAVLVFEGASLFHPSLKRKAEVTFTPPSMKPAFEATNAPQIVDRAEENRREKLKERKMAQMRFLAVPVVEKIKPIKLGSQGGPSPGAEGIATLVSGGANGLVKAILKDGIKSQGDVALEPGTILLGSGSSSEERLFIRFTAAILPDHSKMKIKALAYDVGDRILGLKGKKISDYAFRLAASSGLIFLSGMADGMKSDTMAIPGENRRPSAHDAALNGVATSASEMGKSTMDKMNSTQDRVEVPHSTQLLVIFDDPSAND